MYRRSAIKVLLAIISLSMLFATTFSLNTFAKVRLIYGHKGGALDIVKQIVEDFNKSHPDIEVKILDLLAGPGDWLTRLSVLFAGGSPPDIVRIEYQRSLVYISQGLLRPLDDLAKHDNSFNMTDFFPGAVGAHTVGGKLYAIPVEAQPFTIFINKTRLEEFGIVFPGLDWTIDDLLTVAKRTTKDINGDGIPEIYGWQFDTSITRLEPYFMAFGGRLLNADRTRFMLDSSEVMKALNFLRDAACIYRVKGGSFVQGNAVVYGPSGPWEVPGYRSKITDWDWDIAPVPGGPGGRGTTLGSDGYHISATCRYPKEAWEFIKYMTSVESQTLLVAGGACFPSRSSVATAYVSKKPSLPPFNLRAYAKGIEIGKPTQVFERLIEAERLFSQVLSKVWSNEISPDQAVRELMPQLSVLLKK